MPLVHNGIMYLVNPGNIIQALDGRTGELIWENEVGPLTQIGMGSMRNIAIYEDKMIVATTDARLVALDARTGKTGLGNRHRRSRQGLCEHQRPDRRARQSHPGPAGLRALRTDAASSAPTTRHRQAVVEVQHDRACR